LREEASEVWRFLLGQLHGYRRAVFAIFSKSSIRRIFVRDYEIM